MLSRFFLQLSAWVWAGFVATTLYMMFGWYLLGNLQPSNIAALPPNELGDFLAGIFAPLAFLWLFIAVMVQAQELREQRRELELTRREFEGTRLVAQAQAEEARRQAEFIGRQTEIMTEQQTSRRRETNELVMLTEAKLLAEWIERNLRGDIAYRALEGINASIPIGDRDKHHTEPIRIITRANAQVRHALGKLLDPRGDEIAQNRPENVRMIEGIRLYRRQLETFSNFINDLPRHLDPHLRRMRLEETITAISALPQQNDQSDGAAS